MSRLLEAEAEIGIKNLTIKNVKKRLFTNNENGCKLPNLSQSSQNVQLFYA